MGPGIPFVNEHSLWRIYMFGEEWVGIDKVLNQEGRQGKFAGDEQGGGGAMCCKNVYLGVNI